MTALPADAYRDVPVLVTGATGFIGRAVTALLASCGADLSLAVRRTRSAAERFGRLERPPRIVELPDLDDASIARVLGETAPAIVFNLAGYGISRDERDADIARLVNAELPVTLGRAVGALDAGSWTGARLVHTGSALEYGEAKGDLGEETPPRPTTLYGRTKLAGTEGLATLDIPTWTARLFTVYGPGEHRGRLLPALLECAATGRPLPVTSGSQRRDFTFVEEVAEGMLRLGLVGGGRGSVNLATGTLRTVREFIETAVIVLGIDPRLIRWGEVPTRPEEMSHDPVAIRRLASLVHWRPTVPIREGISRTRDAIRSA